ncbi:Piriformospora indica-insensitive protein [Thalictrum thalictroides]|uniref:Piriformospora indica-insensitive protein n=1 Tax=Thalictrum thalictroides TaxID=46969 RepID=A0A7J6UW05_THATH|nr:Piriformospora indica-insensitive protein [Thalictrum thalictroides]
MASLSSISVTLFIFFLFISLSHSDSDSLLQDPQLSSLEQESVYRVLESINSTINWRFRFPDDICYSSPHGINCEYFTDENGNTSSVHITELNIGYVSESSPNPTCSSTATLSPSLTSLPYLRKLFFYKCFTQTKVFLPEFFSNLSSTLEQLVFIENPSLFGNLNGKIDNMKNLKKLVLSGTNVSGEIPDGVGELGEIEQITLTRNGFSGEIPVSLGKLKKLKVLDLSFNGFEGNVPDSIGDISELFQLDLSSNHFNGRIPESLEKLQRLVFLDLSCNRFANYGIPLFLGEMQGLKEVYLSGNSLGGPIPEIWEKLGGILGIGLSGLGLVGKIPSSMGVFLKNVNYISLANNKLEGNVPEEFGVLESVLNELNLENNMLSGRLPFSANFSTKIGRKLKLAGNSKLCVDEGLSSAKGYLKVCNKPANPNPVLFSGCSSSVSQYSSLFVILLGAFYLFEF